MSIWMAGVPIFGTAQKCVVMPAGLGADEADEVGWLTTRLALSRE